MTALLALLLVALCLHTSSSQTTQFSTLAANGASAGDRFGFATGSFKKHLIVGATFADVGSNGNAGSAYLFDLSTTPATQIAKLTASDPGANDFFGSSVATFNGRAVAGAYLDDTGSVSNHGSAYVFSFNATSSTQIAKLVAPTLFANAQFGYAVAISGDLVAAGAPYTSGSQGAVFLYRCNSTACTYLSTLTVPTARFFGASLAFDGELLVVGAPYTTVGSNANQGAAYVFSCSAASGCTLGATLTDAAGAAYNNFGVSVAVGGSTVVVGADLAAATKGAAVVFQCSSASSCSSGDRLTAFDGELRDSFGSAVATSGSLVAVGAYSADASSVPDAGAAYVYECLSSPCTFLTKLEASDPSASDWLGYSLSFVGSWVAAGVPFDDVNNEDQGTVKLFDPTIGL